MTQEPFPDPGESLEFSRGEDVNQGNPICCMLGPSHDRYHKLGTIGLPASKIWR